MTQTLHKETITSDPNERQRLATDPAHNIWVMASAGTGKTTVLVKRYIRLLLAQRNFHPEKILCLTYTKAAATQMKSRILSHLSRWVCMDECALRKELEEMTDEEVANDTIIRARRLFGMLLDCVDQLNILTIHAFCQSLLSRFQIEADMDGSATIMSDSDTEAVLERILRNIMSTEQNGYIESLARVVPENGWHDLFKLIKNNREKFTTVMSMNVNMERVIHTACGTGDGKESDLILAALRDAVLPRDLMAQWSDHASIFQTLADCPEAERGHLFSTYWSLFFTTEDKPRSFKTKKFDALRTLIEAETKRLETLEAEIRALRTAEMSVSLYKLSCAVLERYEIEKKQHGLLDYDDLIIKTHHLLSDADEAAWIRYKLDGGIDHVLLDEAQDTSPAQWHIIEQIVQDYFAGISQHEPEFRTLFVVGDTKQSIYSFQGADPDTAAWYHKHFKAMASASQRIWNDIEMEMSFRTAQDILTVVDACGEAGLWDPVDHRAGKPYPGRVELHPLQDKNEGKGKRTPWSLPEPSDMTPLLRVVNEVADRVESLLRDRIALPSKHGAAIAPQDILILLRTRKHYPIPLIQALRQRNIPVSGLDSFALTEDIAVQDILSVLRWALFPDDRLALAEILTSPLVGMNHKAMHDHMRQSDVPPPHVSQWLHQMQRKIMTQPVGDVISLLLEHPCPADEISAWRAMIARLGTSCRDPLTQLVSFAQNVDHACKMALPFLRHIERYPPIIKREMEGDQAGTGVRIMTVHGAKGLEAPIVILPDTMITSQALLRTDSLQWTMYDGVPVPLWGYAKDDRSDTLRNLMERDNLDEIAEYHRLLYVAMTRAKDGLFLYGATPTKAALAESWYESVAGGLRRAGAREEEGVLVFGSWHPEPTINQPVITETIVTGIDRLRLLPETEIATASENAIIWKADKALNIGRQWHTLMERAMMADDAAIDACLEAWLADLPDLPLALARERIVSLRAHPDYGFLFKPDGAVEVPFITRNEGHITRGRIDRLVQADNTLWILDYKTRLNLNNMEQKNAYIEQMRGYEAALRPVAGSMQICAALVDIASGTVHPLDFTTQMTIY